MKRKFHAYCVGSVRSGTSSMAGIFSACYRAEHEPHSKELLTIIPALQKGRISKQDFRKYVVYLDNKLQLELNSSFLNVWQLDIFLAEFPDAKFIFTIRDCYSWLNSFMNCLLSERARMPGEYTRFLNFIFGQGTYRYAKEERILKENGLYTLEGFLSYWAKINNTLLNSLPSSRVLVVKTHEISCSIQKIADFLDISPKTLDLSKSHLNKSAGDNKVLSKIDKDYLALKVNLHCKVLMDKFFPGFNS
jgi:hypothetical protein